MQRILVTGNAGSGKTTLSRKLGDLFGIPVISLDRIVWDPGWVDVPKDEVQRRLEPLLSHKRWIIDGVSTRTCEAADTVIFLDFPTSLCFGRALRRSLRHLFSQRPELPDRCPEIAILWKMTKIIFQFPKRTRPNLLNLLDRTEGQKTVIRIRSTHELRTFWGTISDRVEHARNSG
jgi:adenylate kinase family enzyme